MKGKALLCLLLFLIMFLVPFVSMGAQIQDKVGTSSQTASAQSKTAVSAPQAPSQAKPESLAQSQTSQQSSAPQTQPTGTGFKILDTTSGQVINADDRTFLYGAIATEMSPTAPLEALKAQGVASYTYYSLLREQQRLKPNSSLKGADFSANTQGWQIYVTKEQMQSRWGSEFNTNYEKLTQAVNAISGQVLKSNGELIDATYFAISAGKTETSEDIWGGKRTYLVSVASPGDVFAGGFQTSVTLSPDQFKAAAAKADSKVKFGTDPATWVGETKRTSVGSVETIQIGGVSMTGNTARNTFGLRSANFTVTYANNTFTFLVKGYGHGVGMSQTGAQYMANQGSTYKQILEWYYPTTTLTTVNT